MKLFLACLSNRGIGIKLRLFHNQSSPCKKEVNTLTSHSRSVVRKQKDILGMKLKSVKNLFPAYLLFLSLCYTVKGG